MTAVVLLLRAVVAALVGACVGILLTSWAGWDARRAAEPDDLRVVPRALALPPAPVALSSRAGAGRLLLAAVPERPAVPRAPFASAALTLTVPTGQSVAPQSVAPQSVAPARGRTLLSSRPDAWTPLRADDAVTVTVTRSDDGTTARRDVDFNTAPGRCGLLVPRRIDLTGLLHPGLNRVHLRLEDRCGGSTSSTPVYLLERAPVDG